MCQKIKLWDSGIQRRQMDENKIAGLMAFILIRWEMKGLDNEVKKL
jgi:hypothetical protein